MKKFLGLLSILYILPAWAQETMPFFTPVSERSWGVLLNASKDTLIPGVQIKGHWRFSTWFGAEAILEELGTNQYGLQAAGQTVKTQTSTHSLFLGLTLSAQSYLINTDYLFKQRYVLGTQVNFSPFEDVNSHSLLNPALNLVPYAAIEVSRDLNSDWAWTLRIMRLYHHPLYNNAWNFGLGVERMID